MNQIIFSTREIGKAGVLQLPPSPGKKEEGKEDLQCSPLEQKLMTDSSPLPMPILLDKQGEWEEQVL